MIGTTRRHVIRLENGEHRPSAALLGRIAEVTGDSAESFGYPSSDDDEEAASMQSALLDAVRVLIADEFARQRQLDLGAPA